MRAFRAPPSWLADASTRALGANWQRSTGLYMTTQPPERCFSSSSISTVFSAVTVEGTASLLYLMQIELTQCGSSVSVAFSP